MEVEAQETTCYVLPIGIGKGILPVKIHELPVHRF